MQIGFFLQKLCILVFWEFDQNVLDQITIGKVQALANCSLEGGHKFWIALYLIKNINYHRLETEITSFR